MKGFMRLKGWFWDFGFLRRRSVFSVRSQGFGAPKPVNPKPPSPERKGPGGSGDLVSRQ